MFVGVDNSTRVAQEEIFGPVTSVIPYGTGDEAIAANDSQYGLRGAVFTSAPSVVQRSRFESELARSQSTDSAQIR